MGDIDIDWWIPQRPGDPEGPAAPVIDLVAHVSATGRLRQPLRLGYSRGYLAVSGARVDLGRRGALPALAAVRPTEAARLRELRRLRTWMRGARIVVLDRVECRSGEVSAQAVLRLLRQGAPLIDQVSDLVVLGPEVVSLMAGLRVRLDGFTRDSLGDGWIWTSAFGGDTGRMVARPGRAKVHRGGDHLPVPGTGSAVRLHGSLTWPPASGVPARDEVRWWSGDVVAVDKGGRRRSLGGWNGQSVTVGSWSAEYADDETADFGAAVQAVMGGDDHPRGWDGGPGGDWLEPEHIFYLDRVVLKPGARGRGFGAVAAYAAVSVVGTRPTCCVLLPMPLTTRDSAEGGARRLSRRARESGRRALHAYWRRLGFRPVPGRGRYLHWDSIDWPLPVPPPPRVVGLETGLATAGSAG